MKKLAVMLLAVSLLAGAANADFKVFNGSVYDAFITDPVEVGDGSESLWAVTLRIENKTEDETLDPSSFDGQTPEFGYTGITGKLHQQYATGLVPSTPTTDSTLLATAIDTHFLLVIADLLIATAPNEDVTMASAEVGAGFDTDFGTTLTGVFAVDAVPTWILANIVTQVGEEVTLDFYISGTGGGEVISTTFFIPEPATMGLLAVGTLGALIRRRK
ncbi:hypothetical protein LCGC14_0312310 [marine sediment metagenome]|uniref:Ice-binding protein C-terminal domain-containing protein n=1 Tax=marine sediment metagenome TaxID=412755 RepID=A0A0F9TRZ8_9ZZZZ